MLTYSHQNIDQSDIDALTKALKDGFSYSSDNNPLWASEKELLEIINHTEGF